MRIHKAHDPRRTLKSGAMDLLHVFQAANNLALDVEVDSDTVLDALLHHNRLLLQLGNVA